MQVKIIKKIEDPLCLRCSIGGSPDIGFYVVYRGKIQGVIQMLTIALNKLAVDFAEGVEHPLEQE